MIPGQIDENREVAVRISLRTREPKRPIECGCKIVWSEEADGKYRHGGQFVSFEADDQVRLKEYLGKF